MFKDRYTVGNVCLVVFLAFIFSVFMAMVKVEPAAADPFNPGEPVDTGSGTVTPVGANYVIKVNVQFTPVTALTYDTLKYYVRIYDGNNQVLLPHTAFAVYTHSGVYESVLQLVYTAASNFSLAPTFNYTSASVYQTVGGDTVYLDLFLEPPEDDGGGGGGGGGGSSTTPVTVASDVGDLTISSTSATLETNTAQLTSVAANLPAGQPLVMLVADSQVRPTMEYTIPADAQTALGDRQIVLPAQGADLTVSLSEIPAPTTTGMTESPVLQITVAQTDAQGANIGFADTFGTGDFVAASPSYRLEITWVWPSGHEERVSLRDLDRLFVFSVEYDPSVVTDPSRLAGMQRDDDGNVTTVPRTVVHTDTHTVDLYLNHLSYYSVVQSTKMFGDIASHWAVGDILMMAARDIVNGQPNGNFEPDGNVTRAQFAAMLVRTLGKPGISAATARFKDAPVWAWYFSQVETAAQLDLVTGYDDGTFRPDARISRQEMAAMIVRAMNLFGSAPTMTSVEVEQTLQAFADKDAVHAWARESTAKAVKTGIVQGRTETSFQPTSYATRAEAVVMLKRLLKHHGHIQ